MPGSVLELHDITPGRGGGAFPLPNEGTIRIGRADDNDIVLLRDGVAGAHARLEHGEAGFVLRDSSGGAGALVNGAQVEAPTLLRPGDRIRLGSAVFELRLAGASRDVSWEDQDAADLRHEELPPDSSPMVQQVEQELDRPMGDLMLAGRSGGREDRLAVLYRISSELSRAATVDDLASGVLSLVAQAIPCQSIALLSDPDAAGSLRRVHGIGTLGATPISRSIVDHATRARAPVLTLNASCDDRFASAASVQISQIGAALFVPAPPRAQPQLGLYLARAPGVLPFEGGEIDLVGAVALLTATVLSRMLVHESALALATALPDLERLAALGGSLGNLAHDLRNPLSAVGGHLQLVARFLASAREPTAARADADPLDQADASLEQARAALARMAETTWHLSRLAGRRAIEPGPVVLDDVVEAGLALLGSELRQVARIARRLTRPPPIAGQEATLGHLVIVLLRDAAAALAGVPWQDAFIEIRTGRGPDGRPFLTVRDTGRRTGAGPDDPDTARDIARRLGGTLTRSHDRTGAALVRVSFPPLSAAAE